MRPDDADARDAMRRLHRVVLALARQVTAETVGDVVLDEAAAVLGASRAGLWTATDHTLTLVGSRNYDDQARTELHQLGHGEGNPMSQTARTRTALWVESRAEFARRFPEAEARSRGRTPAEMSFVCLPLLLGDRLLGVVAFSFDRSRPFSDHERLFTELICQHAADALERARLFAAEADARRRADEKRRRAEFLGRASAVLAKSLEFTTTLAAVAELAVPTIADWCAIEIVPEEGGPSREVAVAHIDPAKVALARELRRRYPPDRDEQGGVQQVLRTGEPELYPEITDELLGSTGRDAEHVRLMRELGLRSAMVVPIRAEDQVLGAITFVISETPRRYAPLDLTMAQDLADRAGLAISNSRLFEAQRRAVEVRDDFLAIAGHELKTPLTALRLHVEAFHKLASAGPSERLAERAEKSLHLLERMVRLVDELLDVSRITTGRLQLDREAVDLGSVVHDVVARLTDHGRRSRVQVDVRQAITGLWDHMRVDQVVTNLVSNAIKYGQGEPIDVIVEREGDRAVLTVRDRGIGIPAPDQRRIFDRFERAVPDRHYGGFGLGLWIVRQIAEAHGGSVAVTSEVGQGATFRVELPIGDPDQ